MTCIDCEHKMHSFPESSFSVLNQTQSCMPEMLTDSKLHVIQIFCCQSPALVYTCNGYVHTEENLVLNFRLT